MSTETITISKELYDKLMKKDAVEIVAILDRSGSMQPLQDEAISGFNNFLKDQKTESGAANITVNLFDNQHTTLQDSVPIAEGKELTKETFVPRGWTALNDAIGFALDKLERKNPSKAIVAILTDGQENFSTRYTNADIKRKIESAQGRGWKIVYLAANQDAFAVGQIQYGIAKSAIGNFAMTGAGMNAAYSSLNSTASAYRSGSNVAIKENNA